MSKISRALALALSIAVTPPPASPGRIGPPGPGPAPPVMIRVAGEVPRPLELTAEGLSRLPRQTARARGPDGKEAAYEGVPLVELLRSAGVKFGQDLRGPALASFLVVEADDGYWN